MAAYDRIMESIYDAIAEFNTGRRPDQFLDRVPATVLIGETGKLDSLGFLNLALHVEEDLERLFHRNVSVVELVARRADTHLTVASLADVIAEFVHGAAATGANP